MNLKKKLGVQVVVLIIAVAVWAGALLTSAAALPDAPSDYTITIAYYCEETGDQMRYLEMVIGVGENANLLEAIRAELGADWMNLYQDAYHEDGQLTGDLQAFVTDNITVKVIYPLATYTSSATRP